jgi:hypothetical protein
VKFWACSVVFAYLLTRLCYGLGVSEISWQDVTAAFMLSVMPVMVFYGSWLIVTRRTSRVAACTGSIYLAAVFYLLGFVQILGAQVALDIAEPNCYCISSSRCDVTNAIHGAIHDENIVYPTGLQLRPVPAVWDGPGFIPVVMVLYVGEFVLLLWLAFAWRALHKLFSTRRFLSPVLLLASLVAISAINFAAMLVPDWLPRAQPVCAEPAPTVATFNSFPVSYVEGLKCHDQALIDVRNEYLKGNRNGRYADSQAEHDAGINASVGDTLRAVIFFHNSASGTDPEKQTLASVRIKFILNEDENRHSVAGELSADNAPTVTSGDYAKGGNLIVTTLQPAELQFLPGSAYLCISTVHAQVMGVDENNGCCEKCQTPVRVPIKDTVFRDGAEIGSLLPGWDFSGFAIVLIKVRSRP